VVKKFNIFKEKKATTKQQNARRHNIADDDCGVSVEFELLFGFKFCHSV
jgi:hypothetical protein